jgi:lycopene cyclase domain-containing protein
VLAGVTMFLFVKKSIVFITELKYMLPAIIFSGTVFVLINNRFLDSGIISFNPDYLVGKTLFHLPIEEWLFLLIMSLFIFSVYILVNVRFANFEKSNLFFAISVVLLLVFGFMAWTSRPRLVPFFTFFLLVIYFGYTLYRRRFNVHLTKFYISYIIVFIPYFLFKAILNTLPVILYNNDFTLGFWILNVPVEEFGNLFLMMLINITIFEFLKDNQLY